MTRHFLPPAREATAMSVLLIKAARCWREARDSGKAVQPSLFILLSRHGHDMLAPVFDSLMTLAEAVSGKRIVVGSGPDLGCDRCKSCWSARRVYPPHDWRPENHLLNI